MDPLDTVIGQDEAGRDVTARQALQRARDREATLRRQVDEREARIDVLLAQIRDQEQRPTLTVDGAVLALFRRYGHARIEMVRSHVTGAPQIWVCRGERDSVDRPGEDVSAAVHEALERGR